MKIYFAGDGHEITEDLVVEKMGNFLLSFFFLDCSAKGMKDKIALNRLQYIKSQKKEN